MWMLVFLLIYSLEVKGVEICPEPDPVINAYRYNDEQFLEAGSWLNYTCYMNYILLSGSFTRQCQANGTFSHTPPICVYSCGPPPNITDTVIEVPDPSLDGSIASYTCSHDPTITMTAVCRRDLNAWDYDYSVCPHSGNIYQVGRTDKVGDQTFEKLTDGDPITCDNKIGTTRKFWFTEQVDVISFNITFGVLPADLKEMIIQLVRTSSDLVPGEKSDDACGGIITDLKNGGTVHIQCPPGDEGSHGKVINIEAVLNNGGTADLSICEVYAKGNYRNEECHGPIDFEYGTEAFFNSDSDLQTNCLPGFYHHRGVDAITCGKNLEWLSTFIACWPDETLIRPEASHPDQKVLFDLQDETCYTLSTGTDRILGISPSPGHNMIITAISFKFEEFLSRKAFIEPVFKMGGILVNPSCDQRTTRTKTLMCSFDPPGKGEKIEIAHNSSSVISLCEIHVIGHIHKSQAYECFPDHPYLYQGRMNHTIFGHACERWDSVPSSHPIVFDYLPDPSRTQAENYCRNPDKNHIRPWCFIKNYTEEQVCPILKCEDNCFKQKYGKDYEGQLDVTSTGIDCADWSSMNSNHTVQDSDDYDNYCRNPGHGFSSSWCYTNLDGTFERCDSVHCPKELRYIHYNQPEDFTGQLWFSECYWFNEVGVLYRRYRVNITDDWLHDWNLQNNSRLYCFGSEDLTLTEFHIESNDISTTTFTTAHTSTTSEDAETMTATISTEPTTYTIPDTTTTISNPTDAKSSSPIPTNTTASTTTTTSADPTSNGATSLQPIIPENQCYCRCNLEPSLLTHEVAEERIAQINKELYIEKQSLTSTIRKLTSAYDERPSATYLGSSALAIFSGVILLIVLPDIFKVIYHIYKYFRLYDRSDKLI